MGAVKSCCVARSTEDDGHSKIVSAHPAVRSRGRLDSADWEDARSDDSDGIDFVHVAESYSSVKTASAAEAARAYGVALEAILELATAFPRSPPAEIARYLARGSVNGNPKKATPLIRAYTEWRDKELSVWAPPPEDMKMHMTLMGKARDGTRIFHFLGCTVDPNFSADLHVHAMAMFLERHLPRDSTMRLTVLFDTRGHRDVCRNRNIFDIWRHAFALPRVFQACYPERVKRCIVYPTDEITITSWNVLRRIISPATARRIEFLPGSSMPGSPTPQGILDHLDLREITPECRPYFQGLFEAP